LPGLYSHETSVQVIEANLSPSLIHICEDLWKLGQVDGATYGEDSGSLCVLFKLFITSELIENSSLLNL